MSQNDPKTTSLMTSLKMRTPNQKVYFRVQKTGRSVWAFEQRSSAIGGWARALVRQPKTAVF